MPEQVLPGLVLNNTSVREAVCIHTKRVFDSCRDKDCIENLRVWPTESSLEALGCATSLSPIRAEIICVNIAVRPTPYNPGYYTLGITYYYKIFAETSACGCTGVPVTGLAVFEKTAVLCGGTGGAKVFSSAEGCTPSSVQGTPNAVVEALDPILLDINVLDPCRPCPPDGEPQCSAMDFPEAVLAAFNGEDLVFGDHVRRIFVSLGQFAIVKLERDSQLIVPVYDNCLPEKSCGAGVSPATSPCDLFSQIQFPTGQFFPEPCEEETTATAAAATGSCGCKK